MFNDALEILNAESKTHLLKYPLEPNLWLRQSWGSEDCRKLVAEQVASLLEQVQDEGVIRYPSFSFSDNVEYVQGYGLRRVNNPVMSTVRREKNEERFDKFIFVLNTILSGLLKSRRSNKRDLYYQNVHNFSEQGELDELVKKVVSILSIPRTLLGIVASIKGLVAGNIKYIDENGVAVNCLLAEGGEQVPSDSTQISGVETGAQLILVVEKDTVFQRLIQEYHKQDSLRDIILLTGKGVPDLATRSFLHRLTSLFQLPVLVLTDCDPFGFEIMLTYRFGSRSMALCGETLAVPSLFWLGVLPRDIPLLQVPPETRLQLSQADCKKLKDISKRPYLRSMVGLVNEFETLWRLGYKVEIEQVAELSEFSLPQYITRKIQSLEII